MEGKEVRGPEAEAKWEEGLAISLCPSVARIRHFSSLISSCRPPAAGKSKGQLNEKALACPVLVISAFWGRTQCSQVAWLFVASVNYLIHPASVFSSIALTKRLP